MNSKKQKGWSRQVSAQNSPSPPSPEAGKDHAPTSKEISDTTEKRRMQNRLAQRNHRKKVRDHISALEARVIESILQSSLGSSAPTPPSSTIHQLSTLSPLGSSSEGPRHHCGSESFFEFPAEFPEGLNPMPSAAQSPVHSVHPNEYPTPPQSGCDDYSKPGPVCALTYSRCSLCVESMNSSSAQVVEEASYHPQIDPSPQMSTISLSSPLPEPQRFAPRIDAVANSGGLLLIDPRLPQSSRAPITVTTPFSTSIEDMCLQQYHHSELFPPPQQELGSITGLTQNPRAITMPVALPSPYHQHPPQQQKSNDPYVLHQVNPSVSGSYLVGQPTVVSPGGQPQQSYVLVPISDLYPPPHALSLGHAPGHQQDSMYPFPCYHY